MSTAAWCPSARVANAGADTCRLARGVRHADDDAAQGAGVDFSWAYVGPMYALFLLSRGLDVLQVNRVSATYLISVFLFEVPTGAVADLAGRKASFLLSCAVRAAAFGSRGSVRDFRAAGRSGGSI